jgi:hypothetical protein
MGVLDAPSFIFETVRRNFPSYVCIPNGIYRMWRALEMMLFTLLLLAVHTVKAQDGTIGLNNGFLTFNTSAFSVQLVKDSQILYSLKPTGASFNFIPTDQYVLEPPFEYFCPMSSPG